MKKLIHKAKAQEPIAQYRSGTDVATNGKKASSANLKIAALFILLITAFLAEAAYHHYTGGSIVMIDSVHLQVSTNDASAIQNIQVLSGSTQVYSAKGCYSSICTYDLSGVAPGRYTVNFVNSSGFFSGPITK